MLYARRNPKTGKLEYQRPVVVTRPVQRQEGMTPNGQKPDPPFEYGSDRSWREMREDDEQPRESDDPFDLDSNGGQRSED